MPAALKKALNKLKTAGQSSDSDLSTKSPKPNGTNSPVAPSPAGLSSPIMKNSPKSSPRSSGIFSRSSGTFDRKDVAGRSSGTFDRSNHRTSTTFTEKASHSPVRALREKLHLGHDSDSDSTDIPLNRDGEPMSKAQLKKQEKQAEWEEHKRQVEEKRKAQLQKRHEMEERARNEETPEQRAKYGDLPVNNYAGEWKHEDRCDIRTLSASDAGKEVVFRARIHHIRKMSAHLVFFVLRQQTTTVQGVLHEHGSITPHFVYWAEHLDIESIVLVKGIIQPPKAKEGEITGASIHDIEISVHELHVESKVTTPLPFSVAEAEVSKAETEQEGDTRVRISDRTRLSNRIIDLRSTTSQAIFRIQSGLCNCFRTYLDTQGFVEIHTPKLQGGATESGASVFKLDYFGRPAFLAQSPQLAKQMCISADFGRVYEIGAVFRAENSNTHRHLTEYTGLDLEMAIDEHYHEVLRMLDNTFKFMFKGIYEKYRHELDVVKRQFPHEDLVWLDQTLTLSFAEAIRLLNDSGWRDDEGNPLPENEDLGTRDEIQLGRVIKQKFNTDYYIIDKFPVSARPFYAMADPHNSDVTNSFDIFLRGQEILSGGQRIHDADMLTKNMEKLKMDPKVLEEYVQGFEWGAPPHGGGGIGLERMLMLFLNLGDIRHASMYPRDPRSLPAKPVIKQLRHPEFSTLHPPWEGQDRVTASVDFQPIEKLIANYGDASNTSWLEPRTQIWRDEFTGAAVGYVPQGDYAITVGDPLCHQSQYVKTISGYLRWIKKERNLKPLWLLVGHDVEEVLATRFNWRTFSVAAEQRLDPSNNPAAHDNDLQRKIRHAEKEGIKIFDFPIGSPPPQDVREKIDARVKDWLNNRKGKQVHLTDIHPWQDEEHRWYFYSQDKEGTISAFVALAQLSPDHGWQVKYSLDFPGATSGTIEHIVTYSLKKLADNGETNVTFGGGASSKFTPGHNMKKPRVKVLSKAYHAIATELKLTNKSEFREKLGAQEDPVYVCYPPHGLGPMAVKAILTFFEDDE
ncbi:aspartyl-trna cytoplasmic [Diplodia corticola]|uniref:Aspartate--tRNA ligase, cytoplasmic n=1 Tax=Diplodia corticola TaxID=236234 RepID=A0A1J9QP74_9PEZI|nr:aspartyl-trna cytoplasmic [Diplodia corticola]OJD29850.1 aspartyl-trna cytoplasmic [Diplodia corticola]